jgi:hypothetical protein
MDPHRRRQLAVLLGIIGMGVFISLFGLSQLQSKIYVPIDKDTLVLTEALFRSEPLE